MALTGAQLLAHIRHRTGGPIGDDVGGGLSVINQAGRWLMSSRSWESSRRASTGLTFTSGQNFVVLPVDFEEIIHPPSGAVVFKLVSIAELNAVRTGQSFAAYGTIGAINWYLDGNSLVAPRLEIHPTPTSTQANALTLFYRAKWVDLIDDNSVVLMPTQFEALLIYAVRELAYAYEMGSDWGAALGAIQASPLYASAVNADSAQRTLGQMRGGAASLDGPRGDDWLLGSSFTLPYV